MNRLQILALSSVLAVSAAAGAASAATIADSSFEDPFTDYTYEYNPVAAGATFTGDAGVAAYGSAFGYATPPDGVQEAFLQGAGGLGGEIDLAVTGLTVGDVYSFSYYDAERSGYDPDPYTVTFGGATIKSTSPSSLDFTKETTQTFTATSTSGTLVFMGTVSDGDLNTGLDKVTLNGAGAGGVPEPSTWAIMLVGLAGVGATLRRRRPAPSAAA